MTEANYIGLQKAYNMNKTLQHDYKNHLLAISELLKLNKCEEALNYINKYNDYGKNFFANVDSGFSIVDIVVNSKIAESTEKSINFRYEIENIGNIFIEDIDMCALLSNLLDNAIEGCEKVVDRNKEIYLNIFIRNKMLFINISNTINVDIFKKKQLFQTDKENEKLHGWGSYSIDCVVKKYEGTKEYNINKDRIEIIINLPI